jgi:probable FeS assembly SUF system protein SufT
MLLTPVVVAKVLAYKHKVINMQYNMAILSRDVEALLIPSGARIHLHKDTEVVITQELGNTYTVNVYGNLARIDGKDADALGREVVQGITELADDVGIEERVWAQLKTCYDPEIPVNVVDLGLVYVCQVTEIAPHNYQADIKMTLTAPGCGMGPVLAEDVKQKALAVPGMCEVNVEIVFDPPWDRGMMSDVAKLELGVFY